MRQYSHNYMLSFYDILGFFLLFFFGWTCTRQNSLNTAHMMLHNNQSKFNLLYMTWTMTTTFWWILSPLLFDLNPYLFVIFFCFYICFMVYIILYMQLWNCLFNRKTNLWYKMSIKIITSGNPKNFMCTCEFTYFNSL